MKKQLFRKVIFQVGVDVLGFPIYMEHYIFERTGFQKTIETTSRTAKQF